jgi:hypothetical protein
LPPPPPAPFTLLYFALWQLTMAFGLFGMLLWTGLDALAKPSAVVTEQAAQAALRLKPVALVAASVIGVTFVSGAFVAGNDAGHAYNDWPLYAGRVVPELIWDEKVGGRRVSVKDRSEAMFRLRWCPVPSLLGADGTLPFLSLFLCAVRLFPFVSPSLSVCNPSAWLTQHDREHRHGAV